MFQILTLIGLMFFNIAVFLFVAVPRNGKVRHHFEFHSDPLTRPATRAISYLFDRVARHRGIQLSFILAFSLTLCGLNYMHREEQIVSETFVSLIIAALIFLTGVNISLQISETRRVREATQAGFNYIMGSARKLHDILPLLPDELFRQFTRTDILMGFGNLTPTRISVSDEIAKELFDPIVSIVEVIMSKGSFDQDEAYFVIVAQELEEHYNQTAINMISHIVYPNIWLKNSVVLCSLLIILILTYTLSITIGTVEIKAISDCTSLFVVGAIAFMLIDLLSHLDQEVWEISPTD